MPYPPRQCKPGEICGTDIGWVESFLNSNLKTSYYVYGKASSQTQLASWLTWEIESGWSLITLLDTSKIPGWGGWSAQHYIATNGITVNGATLQTVWYVDTASAAAGYSGPYFNSTTPTFFYTWIKGYAGSGQVW